MYNEVYIDKIKFERDDSKKWALPANSIISDAGRQVVEREPNVQKETLSLLMETDWGLLSKEDQDAVLSLAKKDLVERVFYDNSEIGLAHLTQCIKDNLDQPLGELIGRYAYERRIPYLLGALYVSSLMEQHALFYYQYSPDVGYRRIRWSPKEAYVPPDVTVPPAKKKRRIRKKPLTAIPAEPKYDLYACPVCSSPVRLFRCGKNSRLWHACCMDPNRECENFGGLSPSKTEKQAVDEWNKYVLSIVDDPIWSKDAAEFEYSADEDDSGENNETAVEA